MVYVNSERKFGTGTPIRLHLWSMSTLSVYVYSLWSYRVSTLHGTSILIKAVIRSGTRCVLRVP